MDNIVEYKIINDAITENQLIDLGEEGWELVTIDKSDYFKHYIFKRVKQRSVLLS